MKFIQIGQEVVNVDMVRNAWIDREGCVVFVLIGKDDDVIRTDVKLGVVELQDRLNKGIDIK